MKVRRNIGRNRVLASIWALVGFGIVVHLESSGEMIAGQIVAWTATALLGPLGAGLVCQAFRERWFWVGLAVSSGIHAAVVWGLRATLPFPSTLIPIFGGGIEAVGLAALSLKMRELLGKKGTV